MRLESTKGDVRRTQGKHIQLRCDAHLANYFSSSSLLLDEENKVQLGVVQRQRVHKYVSTIGSAETKGLGIQVVHDRNLCAVLIAIANSRGLESGQSLSSKSRRAPMLEQRWKCLLRLRTKSRIDPTRKQWWESS